MGKLSLLTGALSLPPPPLHTLSTPSLLPLSLPAMSIPEVKLILSSFAEFIPADILWVVMENLLECGKAIRHHYQIQYSP